MKKFTLIWLGQLVSTIGSYMTEFALTLWAWQLTGSVTALALVGFFSQLLRIPITIVAGLIVDRFNRKQLMIVGDAISAITTIGIGFLYLTSSLHIWHWYFAIAINGGFGQIQGLAYQTSVSLIVPPHHFTRANSMGSVVHYGSSIISPALTAILYPIVGLTGILLIDLATFGIAISTLLFVYIPQPTKTKFELENIFSRLTFGLRYIWKHPSLRTLLLFSTLFFFFHDLGGAIYDPMILARSNGSIQVLASIGLAAGIGGVTGAFLLSIWGGPQNRVHGMLMGFIGAGIAKTVFGLGQNLKVWFPAQFCSSFNFPLLGSSKTAMWMEAIAPEIQGQVFAANSLVLQGVSAIAYLIAGPLAEHIFEPVVRSSPLTWIISPLFGTKPGAGIALLYVLTSLALILVGIGGYFLPVLRQAGETVSVAD